MIGVFSLKSDNNKKRNEWFWLLLKVLVCFVYKVLSAFLSFWLSINIVEKSILEEELKAFCLGFGDIVFFCFD